MSSNPSLKSLAIIVPVYQNVLNLDSTILRLHELKKAINCNLEIIFINDGSTDGSFEKLNSIQSNNPDFVRVIHFTKNFGQIAAIQAGFKFANSDIIGVISADLQDPPELFLEMLEWHAKGYKLVVAERQDRDESHFQTVFSRLYWKLVSQVALPGYPTGGFDFCIADRQIANVLNTFSERNTHVFPLIFSFGFPIKSIHYKRLRRELGKSQWTFGKKIKLFLDTFIAFSYAPIRIISYLGFLVAGISFLFSIYVVVIYFTKGNQYIGWTSLSTLTAFLGGLILLTLGLIGEYLWRILDQVRGRPLFVVSSDSANSFQNQAPN